MFLSRLLRQWDRPRATQIHIQRKSGPAKVMGITLFAAVTGIYYFTKWKLSQGMLDDEFLDETINDE